jgi:hypothetical protein
MVFEVNHEINNSERREISYEISNFTHRHCWAVDLAEEKLYDTLRIQAT